MPNKQPGVLKGKKVIFQTTSDAKDLAPFASPDVVVAVNVDTATPEDVAYLRSIYGKDNVIGADYSPNAETAGKVNALGLPAVIIQNEGPDQAKGCDEAAPGLVDSGITIAMATNNVEVYPDYVDVAMPYAYPQLGTSVADAQASATAKGGANVMVVVGGDQGPGYDTINEQNAEIAARSGGYGIFPPDVTDVGQTKKMLAPTVVVGVTGGAPTPPTVAGVTGGGGTPPPNTTAPRPKKTTGPRPAIDTSNPSAKAPDNRPMATQVAPKPEPPPPYTGGASPVRVEHLDDGSTRTITATGAVIKQGPDGRAYREGWVDPDKGYDMSTLVPGKDGNPYNQPQSASAFGDATFQPTNPGWGNAATVAKNENPVGVTGATDPTQTPGTPQPTPSPTSGSGLDPYFAAHDPTSHFGGSAID